MDNHSSVKHDASQSKRHRATHESEIDAFLKVNPLPPELEHLRPIIQKFRDVSSLLHLIFKLYAGGYSAEQIDKALQALDKHTNERAQRCVTCLNWTPSGDLIICPADQPYILTICPTCARRMTAGRPSKTMERNFKSYVQKNGGAA